ncbi:MAG: cbb3-type cytochrome c oxidase subunit II [Acidobacteriota bacterium]
MERFSFVFLVAGIFFFALAFVASGWIPMLPVQHLEIRTVEELAAQQPWEFSELKTQYSEAYEKAFGGMSDEEAFAEALRVGHKTYIAEACWHCHSQQIRPWGGDEARYGRRSFPEEYHNELNMPPLWGTRRIGPDLIRRGGRHSNDWHVAHFFHPPDVNPVSVMPSYPWFYEEDQVTPNKTGLSIIAYVQWLGSWVSSVEETVYELPSIESTYPAPDLAHPTPPQPTGGEG